MPEGVARFTVRAMPESMPTMRLGRTEHHSSRAILGGAASNSQMYWKYVPWAYPGAASDFPNNQLAIGLSLAVALIVTTFAAWDFQRRDML